MSFIKSDRSSIDILFNKHLIGGLRICHGEFNVSVDNNFVEVIYVSLLLKKAQLLSQYLLERILCDRYLEKLGGERKKLAKREEKFDISFKVIACPRMPNFNSNRFSVQLPFVNLAYRARSNGSGIEFLEHFFNFTPIYSSDDLFSLLEGMHWRIVPQNGELVCHFFSNNISAMA